MFLFFSLSFSVLSIIIIGFLLMKQKSDLEKRLQDATISSSRDFMEKMDFFFKNFTQAKKEASDQTLSIITPINQTLEKLQRQIDDSQKYKIAADSALQNNLTGMLKTQQNMSQEIIKLMNVFKKPSKFGRWGEVQLEKIIELTGMLQFCDFEKQKSDIDGMRPDITIKLPNGGYIFIDAKTPLEAFLKMDENQNEDDIKKENLKAIKNHIYLLSNKKYWTRAKSPDFVIMFIPVESIWLAAIELDSEILNYASDKNVIVATPMTLIGLLRVIFYGWKQVQFAEEAENLKKSFEIIKTSIKDVFQNIEKIQKYQSMIGKECLNANQKLIDMESNLINKYDVTQFQIKKDEINNQDNLENLNNNIMEKKINYQEIKNNIKENIIANDEINENENIKTEEYKQFLNIDFLNLNKPTNTPKIFNNFNEKENTQNNNAFSSVNFSTTATFSTLEKTKEKIEEAKTDEKKLINSIFKFS